MKNNSDSITVIKNPIITIEGTYEGNRVAAGDRIVKYIQTLNLQVDKVKVQFHEFEPQFIATLELKVKTNENEPIDQLKRRLLYGKIQ